MRKAIHVPILLIFFNRPAMLAKVFEQVREARPTNLYLYQDGARTGRDDDVVNIQACREIVANVNWDCKVHTLYQQKNYGCDPSEYLAIRWFFDNEEKGIILEDDDVPAISFFAYCEELLEKYAGDECVATISGMNHLGRWPKNSTDDYFFAHASSISGWATWKRFVDQWDTRYSFLDDPQKLQIMKKNFLESKTMKSDRVRFDLYIQKCAEHRKSGKEFYETLVSSTRLLNNQVGIFPRENMITNIGNVGESTHGTPELRSLPRAVQKIFRLKRYELQHPIQHPNGVVPLDRYLFKKESLMTASVFNYPLRWIESKIRSILYK